MIPLEHIWSCPPCSYLSFWLDEKEIAHTVESLFSLLKSVGELAANVPIRDPSSLKNMAQLECYQQLFVLDVVHM